jgi:hypothetical protein
MQQNYPYTLTIEYSLPRQTWIFTPVIGGRGGSIVPLTELTQTITRRYETEEDVKKVISEINHKQELLKNVKENFVHFLEQNHN